MKSRFWMAAFLLTVALAAVLALRLPVFQSLLLWFWPLKDTPLPAWPWLILGLAAAGLAAWQALRQPKKWLFNLVLLVLGSYALQMSFALAEGRGLEPLANRVLTSGHSGFAVRAAARLNDFLDMIQAYQPSLESGGDFAQYPFSTKPPGQLAVYMMAERGSRLIPLPPEVDKVHRLADFASFSFPMLASLALVPLFGISRLLFAEDRERWLPLILYTFVPSLLLVQMHLDQALYPLALLMVVWVYVLAVRRSLPLFEQRSFGWTAPVLGFVAGVGAFLASFISFSLAAAGVLCGLVTLILWLFPAAGWNLAETRRGRFGRLFVPALAFLAGILVLYVFLRLLGYDAVRVAQLALGSHEGWKVTSWSPVFTVYMGFLDLLEFVVWLGLPLALLAGRGLWTGLRRIEPLSLATLALLLGLAFFGRTAAETARLWLFLVPLLALAAANRDELKQGGWRSLAAFCALQWVSTLAIKLWMDF